MENEHLVYINLAIFGNYYSIIADRKLATSRLVAGTLFSEMWVIANFAKITYYMLIKVGLR